jgi:uncharacterized protein (DUF2342 family)
LERFAVANSLVFEYLFIWSIVRDQLNSGFWLTRAGTRCKSGLAAATRFATARFTTGWVASVEVQASGILAADLHVDNVSIRLAQHSEDVQYLFDDYFLRYDPWSPQDRVTKIEKDILATRAIFEAAVEFVGRHALRSEIPTIDAIFLAEIASKERRSNLESLLSRIVGNYIPREMHEQGRSFIETVISQCGRRVLPQLFNGMKRTPAWSDLADPERWIGNNGTAARLGDI